MSGRDNIPLPGPESPLARWAVMSDDYDDYLARTYGGGDAEGGE